MRVTGRPQPWQIIVEVNINKIFNCAVVGVVVAVWWWTGSEDSQQKTSRKAGARYELSFLVSFGCFLVKDLVFLVSSCQFVQRCLLSLITEGMMIITLVDHYSQKIQPVCYLFTGHLANVNKSVIHTLFFLKKRNHQLISSQMKFFMKSSGVCAMVNREPHPLASRTVGSRFLATLGTQKWFMNHLMTLNRFKKTTGFLQDV